MTTSYLPQSQRYTLLGCSLALQDHMLSGLDSVYCLLEPVCLGGSGRLIRQLLVLMHVLVWFTYDHVYN